MQVGKVRGFSDIAGKHLVRLTNDPVKRNEVANRLQKIGCTINKIGSDWMTEGNFEPTESKPMKARAPTRSTKPMTPRNAGRGQPSDPRGFG